MTTLTQPAATAPARPDPAARAAWRRRVARIGSLIQLAFAALWLARGTLATEWPGRLPIAITLAAAAIAVGIWGAVTTRGLAPRPSGAAAHRLERAITIATAIQLAASCALPVIVSAAGRADLTVPTIAVTIGILLLWLRARLTTPGHLTAGILLIAVPAPWSAAPSPASTHWPAEHSTPPHLPPEDRLRPAGLRRPVARAGPQAASRRLRGWAHEDQAVLAFATGLSWVTWRRSSAATGPYAQVRERVGPPAAGWYRHAVPVRIEDCRWAPVIGAASMMRSMAARMVRVTLTRARSAAAEARRGRPARPITRRSSATSAWRSVWARSAARGSPARSAVASSLSSSRMRWR